MARRRHRRHNPKRKYKVKHVVIKKNPRHRRRRRNPADPLQQITAAETMSAGIRDVEGGRSEPRLGRPGRGFKASWAKGVRYAEAKQRKRVARALRSAAKAAGKSAKKAKGVTKAARAAQAARLRALASVVEKKGRSTAIKSPLVKALTLKANPSMQSVKNIAVLGGTAAAGFVGLALAGRKVAEMFTHDAAATPGGAPQLKASMQKDGKPTTLAAYAPAMTTAALSAVVAGVMTQMGSQKMRPYGIVIGIGGMIAAGVQALAAAGMMPEASKEGVLADIRKSLSLGEYTTIGSGIFHGFGEYTTVGNAHPFRPRNFADNVTEFAPLGALPAERSIAVPGGRDNAMEFAPGEGGIFAKMPSMLR